MTFQKVNQAVMMSTDEVTAIDRLDFLGIFRLQLFHLVMAKTAMDVKAAMPDVNKVEDRGSLGHAAALLGIRGWFCNQGCRICFVTFWSNVAICRILAEMSQFRRFARHKMSAPRHLILFCTPGC